VLALGSNQIGDTGITAFSSALGSGALDKISSSRCVETWATRH